MNSRPKKDSEKERQVKQAEINNCLAIISGNAQILQREPGITRDQKKRLDRIVEQVDRIVKILEE